MEYTTEDVPEALKDALKELKQKVDFSLSKASQRIKELKNLEKFVHKKTRSRHESN